MKIFHTATDEEIKRGEITDAYFINAKRVLEKSGKDLYVTAEIRAKSLPGEWDFGILCGLEEVIKLFDGLKGVDVYAIPEGSLFEVEEPVIYISGKYTKFGIHETALLGFICQASGIATASARCRIAAKDKKILSFGARRVHPAIAPMIERSAFIGGADSVSSVLGAKLIGEAPRGTMPHAMMLIFGDTVEAAVAFDRIMDSNIPRFVLIDTFQDEKFEAVRVADALKDKVSAVRLDTPQSRKGNFKDIIKEVRWELDLRGYTNIGIIISGGIGEKDIFELREIVDGFGVGSFISRAPHIDFSMDIVEVEGKPIAKRGKLSGRKELYTCPECNKRAVIPKKNEPWICPTCKKEGSPLLKQYIKDGKIQLDLPKPQEIRAKVIKEIGQNLGEWKIKNTKK